MTKPIIGIIPIIDIDEIDPYKCNEHVVTMYLNMILNSGAIPLMLPVKNNEIDKDSLDLCDGFLIPGSRVINGYYYDLIDYAINNNKPLFSICAGMQAIGIYSQIITKIKLYDHNQFWHEYRQIKINSGGSILPKLDVDKLKNHFHIITKEVNSINNACHNINILENTRLYEAYGKNKNIVSLHSYYLNDCGDLFKVSAYSDDNIIEAIEYKYDNFIVGIQGHIEIANAVDKLFKNFINYIRDKKEK